MVFVIGIGGFGLCVVIEVVECGVDVFVVGKCFCYDVYIFFVVGGINVVFGIMDVEDSW